MSQTRRRFALRLTGEQQRKLRRLRVGFDCDAVAEPLEPTHEPASLAVGSIALAVVELAGAEFLVVGHATGALCAPRQVLYVSEDHSFRMSSASRFSVRHARTKIRRTG